MITGEQIDKQTHAERSSWLDSLDQAESLIEHTPIGHRYTFVFVSIIKRALAAEIPNEFRLKFLEWLERESQTHGEHVIKAIEPMYDEAYEMVREAQKLGPNKALDVYARWEVFNAFVALNPSLLTAIKLKWPAATR